MMDYNMPAIKGIDWERAHNYLPSEETLRAVLEETVKTCDKQTVALDEFRHKVIDNPCEDNFASYRIQAHAMKATIRSIGSDLFDMAYALELAGRDGDIEKIVSGTDEFIEEYKGLVNSLKTIVGECSANRAFEKSIFIQKLEQMKDSMNAFDINALQDAFEEISGMDIPDKYMNGMARLEQAVRDLASEDVISCCDELMNA